MTLRASPAVSAPVTRYAHGRAATAPETFEAWLGGRMASRGIRGAYRLAREAHLDPRRVPGWLTGEGVPDDEECLILARFLEVPLDEVRARRLPGQQLARVRGSGEPQRGNAASRLHPDTLGRSIRVISSPPAESPTPDIYRGAWAHQKPPPRHLEILALLIFATIAGWVVAVTVGAVPGVRALFFGLASTHLLILGWYIVCFTEPRWWPTAEGRVIRSQVEPSLAGGYRPAVDYTYVVRGTQHLNRARGLFELSSSRADRASADVVLAKYPPGTRLIVRYDSRQPETAYVGLELVDPRVVLPSLCGIAFACLASMTPVAIAAPTLLWIAISTNGAALLSLFNAVTRGEPGVEDGD